MTYFTKRQKHSHADDIIRHGPPVPRHGLAEPTDALAPVVEGALLVNHIVVGGGGGGFLLLTGGGGRPPPLVVVVVVMLLLLLGCEVAAGDHVDGLAQAGVRLAKGEQRVHAAAEGVEVDGVSWVVAWVVPLGDEDVDICG